MIIAATGHRPNKLGGYGFDVQTQLFRLARTYLGHTPNITEAVSGMALGWDTAWALAALDAGVPLLAAVPFAGQEHMWPQESQRIYCDILRRAAHVEVVAPGGYAPWKMQRRNEWMVDRADRIVALWDGSNGGTANCVRYAKRHGKPVEGLWPCFQQRKEVAL